MVLFVIFVTFCLDFQLTAKPVFKIPHQTLKSDIFLSIRLCYSSAAGEAYFLSAVETQGWHLLKTTSSFNTAQKIFFLVLSAHQGCCCLLSLGPGVEICLGVGFLDFFWWCSHICTEPGPQEFGCVWDKLTLPSLHRPQFRLKGRSLFRVLQNCFHCAWVQMGPYKAEDLVECCPHS